MSMSMSRRNPNHASGFTLIELMIVVAVVAVLAAIAYPSYNDAIRKSRRGQAKSDLLELAQLAERFRTVNGTYTGFAVPAGMGQSPHEGTARYNVAVATTASTFVLTASPVVGAGQDKDTKCLELSLNQAGVKDATGSDKAACW